MECPKCKKDTLEYNREWDEEHDRLDERSTYTGHTHSMIRDELAKKGIFYAKCQNPDCKHIQMKHPGFEKN